MKRSPLHPSTRMIVSKPDPVEKVKSPPGKPRKNGVEKAKAVLQQAIDDGRLKDMLWEPSSRPGTQRRVRLHEEDFEYDEYAYLEMTPEDAQQMDDVAIWNAVLQARVLRTLIKLGARKHLQVRPDLAFPLSMLMEAEGVEEASQSVRAPTAPSSSDKPASAKASDGNRKANWNKLKKVVNVMKILPKRAASPARASREMSAPFSEQPEEDEQEVEYEPNEHEAEEDEQVEEVASKPSSSRTRTPMSPPRSAPLPLAVAAGADQQPEDDEQAYQDNAQISSLEEQLKAFENISSVQSKDSYQGIMGSSRKPQRVADVIKQTRASMILIAPTPPGDDQDEPQPMESDVHWGGTTGDAGNQLVLAELQRFRAKSRESNTSDLFELAELREVMFSREASRGKSREAKKMAEQLDEEAVQQKQSLLAKQKAAVSRLKKSIEKYKLPPLSHAEQLAHFWNTMLAQEKKWKDNAYRQSLSVIGEQDEHDKQQLKMDNSSALEGLLEQHLGRLFESKARATMPALAAPAANASVTSLQSLKHLSMPDEDSILSLSKQSVSLAIQRMRALGAMAEDSFRRIYGLKPTTKPSKHKQTKPQLTLRVDSEMDLLLDEDQPKSAHPASDTPSRLSPSSTGRVTHVSPSLNVDNWQEYRAPTGKALHSPASTRSGRHRFFQDDIDDEDVPQELHAHFADFDPQNSTDVEAAMSVSTGPLQTQFLSVVDVGLEDSPKHALRQHSIRIMDPEMLHPLEGISSLHGKWGYDQELVQLPPKPIVKKPKKPRTNKALTRRQSYPLHHRRPMHKDILFDGQNNTILLVNYQDDQPQSCSEVHISSIFLTDALFPNMLTLRTSDTVAVPTGYLGTFDANHWVSIEQEINKSLLDDLYHGNSAEESIIIPRFGRMPSIDCGIPSYAIRRPLPDTRPARMKAIEQALAQSKGRFAKLLPSEEDIAKSLLAYGLRKEVKEVKEVEESKTFQLTEVIVEKQERPESVAVPVAKKAAPVVADIGYEANGFVSCSQPVSFIIHGKPLQSIPIPAPPQVAPVQSANTDRKAIEAARAVKFAPQKPATAPRSQKSYRTVRLEASAMEIPEKTFDLENSVTSVSVMGEAAALAGVKAFSIPQPLADGEEIDDSASDASSVSSCLSFMPAREEALFHDCQAVLLIDSRRIMQLYFAKKFLQMDTAVNVQGCIADAQEAIAVCPQIYGLVLLSHQDLKDSTLDQLLQGMDRNAFSVFVYDLILEDGQEEEDAMAMLADCGVEDVLFPPYTTDALESVMAAHKNKQDVRTQHSAEQEH